MKKICLITLICCCFSVFAASPHVARVLEYMPAPGQFVNVLPQYDSGDDAESICNKIEAHMVGQSNGTLVSLGGFGGYIVLGFDHTITNLVGEPDFRIYGNAQPNGAEPGIVMVMADANGNGLPDDTWFEIAGSEHHNPATLANYRIVYYRPTPEDDAATSDVPEYIRWCDNRGATGYVAKNGFHSQSYFPQWTDADSLVFEGTLLPANAVNKGDDGAPYYVLPAYEWGYADNQPNNSAGACIDIGWAVDADGAPAMLSGIDFIKIYTATHQANGWIGEASTEVAGVEDLHCETALPHAAVDEVAVSIQAGRIVCPEPFEVYTTTGVNITRQNGHLPRGVYVVKTSKAAQKVVVN